ncbi:MAG: S-layer homology domain-containing protein, partial [bacterium]
LPLPAGAEGNTPCIAVTYAPPLGSGGCFEGQVFMEDGSALDTAAWRVTLYIAGRWPKPTYNEPSVPLQPDGSFSLRYDTAGETDRQQKELELLLLPADFDQKSLTAAESYSQSRAASVDRVEIRRTAAGVTISPARTAPEPTEVAPALPSGLIPVSKEKLAVDVGFYTDGSAAGGPLSEALIRRQLEAVAEFADTVRFYGAGGALEKAYPIAAELGLTVLGSAWLSGDAAADRAELDALIAHCNSGLCRVAIVGSETLLRGDLTEEELVENIQYVRARLGDASIPVTTADSADILAGAPYVRRACNLLFVNAYPYWSGVPAGEAAAAFTASIESLRAIAAGKELLVSETGWPTSAGEVEAAAYYAAIRAWSLETDTPVCYFEAADEPWKAAAEGTAGAHWGFLNTDFSLKSAFRTLAPFTAVYQPSNWAKEEMAEAIAAGLVPERLQKNYRAPISRGDMAELVIRLLEAVSGQEIDALLAAKGAARGEAVFSDTGDTNVLAANALGIILGVGGGRFDPEGNFTRAQSAAIVNRVARVLGVETGGFSHGFRDVEKHWVNAELGWPAHAGILKGTAEGIFSPNDPLTREQAIAVFLRALKVLR